jgi:hypothetical protein
MHETFWIERKLIPILTKIIADEDPNGHANILKELAVAEIRADNTPVLTSKFMKLIGKNNHQVPLKITSEEKQTLTSFINKIV